MLEAISTWVSGSRKAIVGAVVAALVGYMARRGFTIDVTTQDALRTVLEAVVGFVTVYYTTNRVGAVNRKK